MTRRRYPPKRPARRDIKAAQAFFAPDLLSGHWVSDPHSLTPKWVSDTVTERSTLRTPNRRKHARPKR